MARIDSHAPGSFCWAELATTDGPTAKWFYTQLFGWVAMDYPFEGGFTYTMLQKHGDDAAGLYAFSEDQIRQGVPSYWLPYISVASSDETAAKARQLGAQVVAGPLDVMDLGRIAMVRDPVGAYFGIWEAKRHIGATLADINSRHCWTELHTSQEMAATDFYGKLFGWTARTEMHGDRPYTTFLKDGSPVGGMMRMKPEWGEMPPYWIVYFSVPSCDQVLEIAERFGGRTVFQPSDIPNVGRFSILADPKGAGFAIIQLGGAEQAQSAGSGALV